jgi:hypothetical protein
MSAERRGSEIDSGNPGMPSTAGDLVCILTLSGEVLSCAGEEPPPAFTVAAGAIARDAERAARHLGFAHWEAIVVESADGVLGFAAAGADGDQLAVIGFPANTPAGAVQRAATRVAAGIQR